MQNIAHSTGLNDSCHLDFCLPVAPIEKTVQPNSTVMFYEQSGQLRLQWKSEAGQTALLNLTEISAYLNTKPLGFHVTFADDVKEVITDQITDSTSALSVAFG